jgi:hypothetical protein
LGSMHGESAVMYPNRTSLLHWQAQLMRYHGMNAADKRVFVAGCVGAGDSKVKWLMTLKQQTMASERTDAVSTCAWMTRSPKPSQPANQPAGQPASRLASPSQVASSGTRF